MTLQENPHRLLLIIKERNEQFLLLCCDRFCPKGHLLSQIEWVAHRIAEVSAAAQGVM